MNYQQCYGTILRTIMPQSFPIGVKIIKKDELFPEKAVRPAKYVNDLTKGLEATQKTGTRYPVQSYLLYEPPHIPPMKELEAKLLNVE